MEWLGYISMKIIVFYTNVGKVKTRETLPPCGPEGKELHAILGGRALQPLFCQSRQFLSWSCLGELLHFSLLQISDHQSFTWPHKLGQISLSCCPSTTSSNGVCQSSDLAFDCLIIPLMSASSQEAPGGNNVYRPEVAPWLAQSRSSISIYWMNEWPHKWG